MTKYTGDMSFNIIQRYNTKAISQKEYEEQMGITRAQFQYWLMLYEFHGEEG